MLITTVLLVDGWLHPGLVDTVVVEGAGAKVFRSSLRLGGATTKRAAITTFQEIGTSGA